MSNHYKIINRPVIASHSDYQQVFDVIFSELNKSDSIKCIGTFGNINKPGISDIDIIVIFKTGTNYNVDLISILPSNLKQLFTHGLMALNEDHFKQNEKYTFWDNFKLISGELPAKSNSVLEFNEADVLKKQTALEFMIANYIDLKIQKCYGIIKLRDLLQHTKGLKYDLDYLGIKENELSTYVQEIQAWISDWFIKTPKDQEIIKWFKKFEADYERIIIEILSKYKFYLPTLDSYNYSKNNKLTTGSKLSFHRNGILLPSFMSSILDKKYIRIQNNLNKFTFEIPFETKNTPQILNERISFFGEMKKHNINHYPKFASLIPGLISKLV